VVMAPSNRKSLNARKMEKNFIAVIEKGYTRQPAIHYPLADPLNPENPQCHLGFINRELAELSDELLFIEHVIPQVDTVLYDDDILLKAIDRAKDEVADVSNTLDYCYERLSLLEDEYNGKKNKEE